MFEVRPSFVRTGGLFALMALSALTLGGLARGFWDQWVAAGVLTSAALAVGFFALALLWRMIRRAVMIRLDTEGIYVHRLRTLVPWEALAQVERISHQGAELFALTERDGGHPVFRTTKITIGAGLNDRVGLPPLALSMSGMDCDNDRFAQALSEISPVPVIDRR